MVHRSVAPDGFQMGRFRRGVPVSSLSLHPIPSRSLSLLPNPPSFHAAAKGAPSPSCPSSSYLSLTTTTSHRRCLAPPPFPSSPSFNPNLFVLHNSSNGKEPPSQPEMKSPCPTASAASTILPRVEVPSSPSSGAAPTIVLHLRSPSHPHTTTSGDDGEEACKEDDLRRFIYVSMKEEDEVLQKIGPKPSRGVMEEGDFLQKIIGLLPYGDCQLRRPHFL